MPIVSQFNDQIALVYSIFTVKSPQTYDWYWFFINMQRNIQMLNGFII